MTEKVGNRVIPVVTLVAVVVIMVILSLTRGRDASANGPPVTEADMGRQIYNLICITCHDPDPTVDRGTERTYGPAVAGSSLELLRLRVRDTKYPEGYTPKRNTTLMTPLPQLTDNQIRALHAFLSQAAAGSR